MPRKGVERANRRGESCLGKTEEGGNGPEGIRTPDLRDANAALSQLSHRPTDALIIGAPGGGVKARTLRAIEQQAPVIWFERPPDRRRIGAP